jgi:hypothetical protein
MSAIAPDRTICDQCGKERGPLDDEKRCEVCAADWKGYMQGRSVATLLSIGYAIERALEDGAVTPDQVRNTVELALVGQTHGDDVQSIAEGLPVAPTDAPASSDTIDGVLGLLGRRVQDTYETVMSARRVGQPIDTRFLYRRLHAALDGLGGSQWLKVPEA